MSKVSRNINNGCWIWRGCIARRKKPVGYFYLGTEFGEIYAHRAAWSLFKGPIPIASGRWMVMQKCGNSLCVNPDHLDLCSYADGCIRYRKIARGPKHGMAKLSEETVKQIKQDLQVMTIGAIVKKHRVNPGTVYNIRADRQWKSIAV